MHTYLHAAHLICQTNGHVYFHLPYNVHMRTWFNCPLSPWLCNKHCSICLLGILQDPLTLKRLGGGPKGNGKRFCTAVSWLFSLEFCATFDTKFACPACTITELRHVFTWHVKKDSVFCIRLCVKSMETGKNITDAAFKLCVHCIRFWLMSFMHTNNSSGS